MKRFTSLCVLLFFVLHSCKKEISSNQPGSKLSGLDVSQAQLPSNTVPIQFLTSTGTYRAIGYNGANLDFGSNLAHDITPDPTGIHDGEPVMGVVSLLDVNSQTVATLAPPYFDLLIPKLITTLSSSAQQKINEYNQAWVEFEEGKDTSAPDPQSGFGISADWFIEVKGMVIRDHNSPTDMSVCPDTYIKPLQITKSLLGTFVKNGYTLTLYGPNLTGGQVNAVSVKNATTTFVVKSYSATYTLSPDKDHYIVQGSITLTNGTVITINDTILAYTPQSVKSLLCSIVKNGYTLTFYGPSITNGQVNKVTAKSGTTTVVLSTYSVTYTLSSDANYFLIKGSVTLPDGTSITLFDSVDAAP